MLSIGAFAQIGQVTHRMLRHWDATGLLVPAHVDELTGYRSYDPSQLARLHRIVALRELGFGIDDVAAALADGVADERLTELLETRREAVEREHALASARLADVERRLRLISEEKTMSTIEIVVKPLPALRLAARRAHVTEQPEISAVVGPLFGAVAEALQPNRGLLETPVAQYAIGEDGIDVVVGYAYDGEPRDGFEIVTLPAVAQAACAVHLGPMERIPASWQSLHGEAAARGLAPDAPCRELYVRAEGTDQADWVTELQQPVAPA
ncbi:MerR family transcriptional regulator [Isoptericola haloaureus]|uniref:MerR family transcriptional regulator n=1 Tax=Isoptericola haloaureus TaxID=1542902 RepID=A0ABU7Z9J3_9MICO